MLRLILLFFITSSTYANNDKFSKNFMDNLSDKNFFWKKNSNSLSNQAKRIRGKILKEFIKSLKKEESQQGGLSLIEWPRESIMVKKYMLKIIQEERM